MGLSGIIKPFLLNGKIEGKLLIVFAVINLFVLINVVIHPPTINYDADGHLEYIRILAEFKLPTKANNYEFFSPPLPYAIPALVKAAAGLNKAQAGKAAQVIQFFLSLGLTYLLIKICRMIKPNSSLAFCSLLF